MVQKGQGMIASILLLILSAGVPYYVLLEKNSRFSSKKIFLLSGILLLAAVILSCFVHVEHAETFVMIALASALFSIYRALKTTNFYKLGYHLIFVNAPFFIFFEGKGVMYSLSLMVALFGLYLVGRFYEKNYGSANYQYITGITLATPYIGAYLSLYLITLALYPPLPNGIYFLGYLFKSDMNLYGYIVVAILFFGNFFLAMRVMTTTLFGRVNSNIHYVQMTPNEKLTHLTIVVSLLLLSAYGLKEMLA
jgi:hypothetical protein